MVYVHDLWEKQQNIFKKSIRFFCNYSYDYNGRCLCFIKEDASWLSSAIDTLIITGGALLGLGIADNAFDKKEDEQKNKYNNGKKK